MLIILTSVPPPPSRSNSPHLIYKYSSWKCSNWPQAATAAAAGTDEAAVRVAVTKGLCHWAVMWTWRSTPWVGSGESVVRGGCGLGWQSRLVTSLENSHISERMTSSFPSSPPILCPHVPNILSFSFPHWICSGSTVLRRPHPPRIYRLCCQNKRKNPSLLFFFAGSLQTKVVPLPFKTLIYQVGFFSPQFFFWVLLIFNFFLHHHLSTHGCGNSFPEKTERAWGAMKGSVHTGPGETIQRRCNSLSADSRYHDDICVSG